MKTPIKAFGWKDSLVNKEAIRNGVEDHNTAVVKYDDVICECQTCWGTLVGVQELEWIFTVLKVQYQQRTSQQ